MTEVQLYGVSSLAHTRPPASSALQRTQPPGWSGGWVALQQPFGSSPTTLGTGTSRHLSMTSAFPN